MVHHNLAADDVIDSLRELVAPGVQDSMGLHARAIGLVARLKALNRASNNATRIHKEATTEARQEMDQAHLNLQNLYYEKRHLEREIEKCRQFASIYQDVPLYSLDEFKTYAPAEARTAEVLADEHQLMLNRLSFELVERQRLDLRKRELLQQKEQLLKESKANEATLENIRVQVDLLVKTATETQKKVSELCGE